MTSDGPPANVRQWGNMKSRGPRLASARPVPGHAHGEVRDPLRMLGDEELGDVALGTCARAEDRDGRYAEVERSQRLSLG